MAIVLADSGMTSGDVPMATTIRLATADDVAVLVPLMEAAIEVLQKGYLDDDQIESSKAIMGIDRQLIDDGTYFVVEIDSSVAGCGGWSRRATLYGGDHSVGNDAGLLDPATDPARVRAMYTHPDFARRGVGRLVLGAWVAGPADVTSFCRAMRLASRPGGGARHTSVGTSCTDCADAVRDGLLHFVLLSHP